MGNEVWDMRFWKRDWEVDLALDMYVSYNREC